jgi:HEAT repeat protein
VHSSCFEQEVRNSLRKKGKTLEEELAREARETQAVNRAISQSLPALLPFLADPIAEVRMSVAEALAEYPEHEAVSLPALEEALAFERDPGARDAMAKAVNRLSDK